MHGVGRSSVGLVLFLMLMVYKISVFDANGVQNFRVLDLFSDTCTKLLLLALLVIHFGADCIS